MVVGFVAMVLIGYNGLIDKPGTGPARRSGSASTTATGSRWWGRSRSRRTGFLRSQAGQKRERKAPGTV